MADVAINISTPIATVVEAVSRVIVAILEADIRRRETMSEAAKAEQDKIMAQMYWDWRGLLKAVGIVGEPGTPNQ